MQPFSVDDLYRHRKVTELHCLPGPNLAVATVRSVDRDNDQYRSAVWCFPLDGRAPRRLTAGPEEDSSARLSPGGERVAFISDRDAGRSRLHLVDLDGGDARACGELPGSVASPRWSPDGAGVLATVSLDVDPDRHGARGVPATTAKTTRAEVAWRLPHKSDGIGYLLSREVHLFRIDAQTGAHRQLTDGAFDVMGFDPSPDGRRIAHVRTREGRYAHCTDLWVCDHDGANARRLTSTLATVQQPVWSPDGRWIAFSGAEQEGDGQSRLCVYDLAEERLQVVGEDEWLEVAALDSALHWTADGRLVFARARGGAHHVVLVSPSGGELHTLRSGDQQFGAFGLTDRHLVFSAEHPALASELHCADLGGAGERQLSDLNPWWQDRPRLEVERRRFAVPDGRGGQETIEGWLMRTAGSAQQPQPLLDDAHGGPGAYALLDYDTNVFWHVLCSRGWSVLALNPVGSSSYGRSFCTRLTGHWGTLDLPQHLAAIRQLQAEGIADDRLAISGKSYGGYLTAWAIGHTQAFRAAVVMAPVGNVETHYGTSDGGYYADPLYVGTTPRFDRALARRLSPLQFLQQATTPTLFMQGKDDERCPKGQSEELFVNLYTEGTAATELVLYPGENHHFLGDGKPGCRADAAQRILDWVERHVNDGPPSPTSWTAP